MPLRPVLSLEVEGEPGTADLARLIAAVSRRGDVICLWGPLGIGKTVFARALVRTLGDPQTEVPSPSFTLVQTYGPFAAIGGLLYHFDLFRIENAAEVRELGFEEAMEDGVILVEWPDRLGPLLPTPRLDVRIAAAGRPEARQITLVGSQDWERRLRSPRH